MSADNTPAPQVEIQLPELPEPQKECWIGHDLYSADQMRAYAQAAMNARAGGDAELRAAVIEYRAASQAFADDGQPGNWIRYENAEDRLDAALASQAVGVKDGR